MSGMASNPAIKKDQIRRYVQRLLNGERKPEYIHRVMLWLRTRSHGHAVVKEIGDGIAHFDERNQGLIFARVSDFFDSFDYIARAKLIENAGPMPPGALSRHVEASIRRGDPAHIKRFTRLGQRTANRAARIAVAKITSSVPIEKFTREERVSLEYFASLLTVGPALTASELAADLRVCLTKNGLLLPDENAAFAGVVDYLSAYMVTLMHGTELPLYGGAVGRLRASIHRPEEGGRLCVNGQIPIPGTADTAASFGVFITDCGVEWCSEEIQAMPKTGGTWIPDIEMDDNGIIHFVD